MAHTSQAMVRIGEDTDLYYTDPKNCEKQAIPVEYNTRFQSEFSNKGTGVSVFTIPPGNGLRHVVVVIGYNAGTLAGQLGAQALPRGWGYQAISQVSFRIGGSSQYFLTGQQLLARNMRLCRTKEQRNSILSLGGAEAKAPADFARAQYAYIPISVFAAPSADGISLPLPADLLSQQVQITCQLNPTSSFWTTAITGGASPAAVPVPAAFDVAYFRVEQLVMNDRAMSLASRVDLNTHSYTMPLPDFDQQEQVIPLTVSTLAPQSVVLTGFRAGEVKKLQIWLTKDSDAVGGGAGAPQNPGKWYIPTSIEALYAGVIYSQYQNGESKMWNLLDGTAPAAVDASLLTRTGDTITSTPYVQEWVELPFSQPTGNDYDGEVLVHGKEITNGIVNLSVATPTAATDYKLHVAYCYNASVSFSRGSADLIF